MNISEKKSKQSYVEKVSALTESLPDNSITRASLLAIQSNEELPKHHSREMQEKLKPLQKSYHKPDISENERLAVRLIFQEKLAKSEPSSKTISNPEESIPECLQNFSAEERSMILEFVRFCIKDFSLDKDLKQLESMAAYVEALSFIEMERLLSLIQSMSQPTEGSPLPEETQKLIKLIQSMIPKDLSPINTYILIFNLFAATSDKSLKDSLNLFLLIKKMIPNGASNSIISTILHCFSLAIKNKSVKESENLLENIKKMIPEDSDFRDKVMMIESLLMAFSGRSSKDSIALLNTIISMIPPGIDFEFQNHIIINSTRTLSRKSFNESKKLLKLINSMAPLNDKYKCFTLLILTSISQYNSFEDCEKLLKLILDMPLEGIPVDKVCSMVSSFPDATENNFFEKSEKFLEVIRKIIHQKDLTEAEEFYANLLSTLIIRGKSLDETFDLLNEVESMNPLEIDSKSRNTLTTHLGLILTNKSFAESKKIFKLIRDMTPEGIHVDEACFVVSKLSEAIKNLSFEEAEKLLKLLRDMTPEGADVKEICDVIIRLGDATENKSLEESQELLEFIIGMIPQEGLTSEDIYKIVINLEKAIKKQSFKQSKELLALIKSLVSEEGLRPKATYQIVWRLAKALSREETTFEQSKELLEIVQSMIPQEDLTPENIYTITVWLALLLKDNNYKDSKELLALIKNMIPLEGLTSKDTYKITAWLAFLLRKNNFETSKELLEFIKGQCWIDGLSDTAKYHSVYSLTQVLKENSLEDTKDLLNQIKDSLPESLIRSGIASVLAKMGETKSKEVIEIIKKPKYAEHQAFWSFNVLPFITDEMNEEIIMTLLDEFIPPKINTLDEAERLSKAIEPFIRDCETSTEVQELCEVFTSLSEELKLKYSSLIQEISFNNRNVGRLIKWIQKIDPQTSTQEEFLNSLKQYLEGPSSSQDKYALASDVLQWKIENEALILSSKRSKES